MSSSPPPALSWTEKWLPAGLPHASNHPAQIALRTYVVALSLSLGPSLLPFAISLFARRKESTRNHTRSLKNVLKRELGPNGFAFAITVAVGGGAALQNIWQSLEDSSDHEFGTDIDSTSCASTVDAFSSPSGWERNETYRKQRRWISSQDVSPSSRALLSNLIASTFAIILLQGRRGRYRPIFRPAENIDIPLTMPIDVNATKYGPSPTLDLTLLLLVRAV